MEDSLLAIKSKFLDALDFITLDRQLTPHQTELYMQLSLICISKPALSELPFDAKSDNEDFLFFKKTLTDIQSIQILLDRLNQYAPNVKISIGALSLLSLILNTPKDSVIYAYFFYNKFKDKEVNINLNILNSEIFANGYIQDSDLERLWNLQKIDNDNGLDLDYFWLD